MKQKLPIGESGFSLIELLIVIVIMAVVLAAVFGMMNDSLKISTVSNQTADAQQSLRTAQEYISRDLYNAADGLRDVQPRIRQQFMTAFLTQDLIDANELYPQTAMVIADDNVIGNVPVALTNDRRVVPGTDRLTILTRPDPGSQIEPVNAVGVKVAGVDVYRGVGQSEMYVSTADAATIQPGGIYLLKKTLPDGGDFSSAFVTVTAMNNRPGGATIVFGPAAGAVSDYSLNAGIVEKITGGLPTVQLTLQRVWMIHYFVDKVDNSPDDNNRLVRRVFGESGGAFTENIIAEHVKQLQFRYILRETIQVSGAATVQTPETVDQFANESKHKSVGQIQVEVVTETARRVINNQRASVSSLTVVSPRNLQFNLINP